MPQINELTSILNQHFQWNKARMDCLIGMVIALFLQGDDKPDPHAQAFPSKAKADSNYRRLQRFISDAHCVDYDGGASVYHVFV